MSSNGNGNGDIHPTKKQRLSALFAAFVVFAAFATGAAIAGVTYLALQNKQQGDNIERVLEVTRDAAVGHEDAAKILIDCNTPGGECFEQQQRQVQELEVRIALSRQETIIAAFLCNDRPGGQRMATLTACVNDVLKRGD